MSQNFNRNWQRPYVWPGQGKPPECAVSLSVCASALRRHEQAEAETEANTVTERLFLPGALGRVRFLRFARSGVQPNPHRLLIRRNDRPITQDRDTAAGLHHSRRAAGHRSSTAAEQKKEQTQNRRK